MFVDCSWIVGDGVLKDYVHGWGWGVVLAECMYGGGQCSESAGMVGGGVLIRVDAW